MTHARTPNAPVLKQQYEHMNKAMMLARVSHMAFKRLTLKVTLLDQCDITDFSLLVRWASHLFQHPIKIYRHASTCTHSSVKHPIHTNVNSECNSICLLQSKLILNLCANKITNILSTHWFIAAVAWHRHISVVYLLCGWCVSLSLSLFLSHVTA